MENDRLLDKAERTLWGEVLRDCACINCSQALCKVQDAKSISALINWMDEPCTEHEEEIGYNNRYSDRHYLHRKDCPQCWQSLKGKFGES